MPGIAIQIDTTADPAAAWTALTTTEGGWLVDHPQPDQRHGRRGQMWFPDAPMAQGSGSTRRFPARSWPVTASAVPRSGSAPTSALPSSRIRRAAPGSCSTTPSGFTQVDEMFRVVTLGWARCCSSSSRYRGQQPAGALLQLLTHHSGRRLGRAAAVAVRTGRAADG